MGHWLASGRRRDLCVLLYDTDGLRGQELKARLEDRYDERLDPTRFYGALDGLVDAGHVEERAEGIHDVYALTDAGRAAVEEHVEWLLDAIGRTGDSDGSV